MTLAPYQHIPIQDAHEPLVDLSSYPFVLEPVYFKDELSPEPRMFLRKTVADKLLLVQNTLEGFRFKIWDGYRPRAVQNSLYQKVWNEFATEHPYWSEEKLAAEVGAFVTPATDPNRIPPHATGGAVDLTLVDENGNELDMGTEFDYFGPESAALYFEQKNLNEKVKKNRRLLRESLLQAGFSQYAEEWWHLDYGNQLWAIELNKPYALYGEITQ